MFTGNLRSIFGDNSDLASLSSLKGTKVGSALCVNFGILKCQQTVSSTFSLAWDHPIARFGPKGPSKSSSNKGLVNSLVLPRYYTRFFGCSGLQALHIALYGLIRVQRWEERISEWQSEIISLNKKRNHDDNATDRQINQDLRSYDTPEYYQYHLFNEAYFLVDGGTSWLNSSFGSANTPDEHFQSYLNVWTYHLEESSTDMSSQDSRDDDRPDMIQQPSNSDDSSIENNIQEEIKPEDGDYNKSNSVHKICDDKIISQRVMKCLSSLVLTQLRDLGHDMEKHSHRVKYSNGKQDLIGQFLYYEGHVSASH